MYATSAQFRSLIQSCQYIQLLVYKEQPNIHCNFVTGQKLSFVNTECTVQKATQQCKACGFISENIPIMSQPGYYRKSWKCLPPSRWQAFTIFTASFAFKLDGWNKEDHERKKPKGRPVGRQKATESGCSTYKSFETDIYIEWWHLI